MSDGYLEGEVERVRRLMNKVMDAWMHACRERPGCY